MPTTNSNKFVLLVFCLLTATLVLGQNATTDSLKTELGLQKGKERLPTLFTLIDNTLKVDYALSESYLAEAEALIGSDTLSKSYADLLLRKGRAKKHNGTFGQAVELYQKALALYKEYADTVRIAYTLSDIGSAYFGSEKNEKAGEYWRQSLAYFEGMNNLKGQSDMLNNLGMLLDIAGKQNEAIEYFQKSLGINERIGDEEGMGKCYINLGIILVDKAEYGKAMEYYTKAEALFRKLNRKDGITVVLLNQAHIERAQGKIEAAAKLYNSAYDTAMSSSNDYRAHYALWQMAEMYREAKMDKEAYQYLYKYLAMSDSLQIQENSAQLAELDARYQNELKEQEIALLSKEKALQQAELKQRKQLQTMLLVLLALTIALGAAVFLYLRMRQKSKQTQQEHRLKLRQAEAERLKELNDVKSSFFTNIAHEFRTPLTLIMGPAEQIRTESESPRIKKNASLIGKSAGKLLELVNQLLELSKLESGTVRLKARPDDLTDFVKGITFSFESLAADKNIGLAFNSNCSKAIGQIDPERTDKIFVNLLSNAFKFTPDSGLITVSLAVKQMKNNEGEQLPMAEITVTDTGLGIPTERLPHIFTRFYQATDTEPGTGIGLALVKELVTLHGGSIKADSVVGRGTTITLMLPVSAYEESPVPEKISINQASAAMAANTNNGGFKLENLPNNDDKPVVLVVEDNEEVRNYTVKCLWERYHVLEAPDGATGVEMALKHVPDLVLSDVMMPEKDGLQVCSKIKADQKTSHVPVILLTAKADVEHKIKGLESGADDYLSKPFHQGELLARVNNMITGRQELRQKFSEAIKAEPEKLPGLQTREDAFILKLYEVLEQNLSDETFGIEQLCREAGMSRTQLHRKLKALTNLSASHFIRHYRLQRALGLLKQDNFTVAEVAYRVGFSSPSYFTQCFNEVYGFAPSAITKSQ